MGKKKGGRKSTSTNLEIARMGKDGKVRRLPERQTVSYTRIETKPPEPQSRVDRLAAPLRRL